MGISTIHHHFIQAQKFDAFVSPRATIDSGGAGDVPSGAGDVPSGSSSRLAVQDTGRVQLDQFEADPSTMWGPLVISWFISPNNYSYNYHKP